MQIITLTSDMGINDFYVASVKANILKLSSAVQIVDISHQVKPFDIPEAVYLLRNCFYEFPEGTIHIIGLDDEPNISMLPENSNYPSILKFKGHYFIGNDNGFFGAFLNHEEHEGFYQIDDVLSNPNKFNFPTKNMFVPAACKLANGEEITSIASLTNRFKTSLSMQAIFEENLIKGHVIHIDNYGNLITNIHQSDFSKIGKNAPFIIYIRKKDYQIDVISDSYNSVHGGEKVAFFNYNGFLEIAINRGTTKSNGGANQLLGVKRGDLIRIDFQPKDSVNELNSLF